MRGQAGILIGVLVAAGFIPAAQDRPVATNVLAVTMDGMRWQELFGGMDRDLLNEKDGGVRAAAGLVQRFGGATPEERRAKLMPFFWTVVARDGQVFGDPSRGSFVRVTNGLWFSYPGYHELLAGFPDPRIDSNGEIPNPNITVLEWLGRRPGFEGRVAAFASWELLPWILNTSRSGLASNGDGPPVADAETERGRLLNDVAADLPPYWGATRFDAPTLHGALEYLRTRKPRVLYVMLGETDEWAHERRYDLYLDSAARNDRMIRRLWETAQAMPEYANRTALVLATDHGRGSGPADWIDHGRQVPAAERIWMAALGPGIAPRGLRSGVTVTQGQYAATIAALLGEDYARAEPRAAAALDLH